MDENKMFDLLEKIYIDVQETKEKVNSIESEVKNNTERLNKVETEIKKSSIVVESIERKIDTIAEVQISHKQQSEFGFKNTDTLIDDKTDLLASALKNVSKDVSETKESIEVLKEMTGKHEVDINILKRRPV